MNYNDGKESIETKRTVGQLYQRLKRYGYRLQSGRTIPTDGTYKIQLKRVPIPHGFKITDMTTGEVVGGKNYDLTLGQVNRFWERENMKRIEAKREEDVRKRWEENKLRMPSSVINADEDRADENENEVDHGFAWESSETFFDD